MEARRQLRKEEGQKQHYEEFKLFYEYRCDKLDNAVWLTLSRTLCQTYSPLMSVERLGMTQRCSAAQKKGSIGGKEKVQIFQLFVLEAVLKSSRTPISWEFGYHCYHSSYGKPGAELK